MSQAIVGFSDFAVVIIGLLLLVSVFAYGPVAKTQLAGAVRVFVAFFLTLLGLALMFSSVDPQGQVILGAFIGALGLSYFWMTVRKGKS